MNQIRIGTSGFSFNDWIGEVYPREIKKTDMLSYYERSLGFDTLEVNFTYYAMPSVRTMESFAKKTSSGFSFVLKAYKAMTHERSGDFRKLCNVFRDAVRPLEDRYKGVLFQFPYSFRPDTERLDYLKEVRDCFSATDVIIEFRNASWLRQKYIDMLKNLRLGFCVVDEPKLTGLMPFHPVLTSDTGYFRFHGRNVNWFRSSIDVRYDYLYTAEELKEFIEPVESIASQAMTTYVFFNNCHAGKAVKNAVTFMEMLKKTGAKS